MDTEVKKSKNYLTNNILKIEGIIALITLVLINILPALRFEYKKTYEDFKLFDLWVFFIGIIPSIALVCNAIFSFSNKIIGVFISALTVSIITFISFMGGYSILIGGYIDILCVISILIIAIIEFCKYTKTNNEKIKNEININSQNKEILIQGKPYFSATFNYVGIIISIILFLYSCKLVDRYDTVTIGITVMVISAIFFIFSMVTLLNGTRSTIYVSKSKIWGKTLFGKRVDIPVDAISAISSTKLLKGIAVSSASGKIIFTFLKNNNEIYNEISKIINDRSKKINDVTEATNESNIDNLKKLKELYDSGVLTEKEFEESKQKIINKL